MRAAFDRWWVLPLGILAASALVALGIAVFGSSLTVVSSAEVERRASGEPTETDEETTASEPAEPTHHTAGEPTGEADGTAKAREAAEARCADPSRNDYVCMQKRYRDLVRGPGVEAAFAALEEEMARDEQVNSDCHVMTHFIGRAAAEVYGDIPSTYSRGNSFCGSGYYHGAMETIVEKIGPDRVLEQADALCADLGGGYRKYSFHHYNCAHGLRHGFMNILENDLFASLETCDTLADGWESNRCYGGVFMENVASEMNPGHPSEYLKADEPLYPCDTVGDRHKDECYQRQTSYALETRGNDFAGVFGLCEGVEDKSRPSCYQGLGWDASVQSLKQSVDVATVNRSTEELCMLGKNQEARSDCVVGAVEYFVRHYYSDAQPGAFCGFLASGPSRAACFREVEEYYAGLRSPLERRRTSS